MTLSDLLYSQAADAVAIAAPGRSDMTYGRLRRQVLEVATNLAELGIERDGSVALVLPNGPEMVPAFLGTCAAAIAAPLNPAYRQSEFDFYLEDLRARALIAQAGVCPQAVDAARARGIPVIRLDPALDGPAGQFALLPELRSTTGRLAPGHPHGDDLALLLHTSGTTARPKLVPLTHRNLHTSAMHMTRAFGLTAEDRCLSLMPLFHIHGLVASVLAPIGSGGSVFCTPGFNAHSFWGWLSVSGSTWYTAVPTMHQAILARAGRGGGAPATGHRLRFVRSCSAPLPATVGDALERTFGVPVISSYGMTEASHQIATNPLPPQARKPGTVGLATGPQIAIMDERGRLLPARTIGEVVIRGDSVTHGYLRNEAANAAAFVDGWFRTGDQGTLDDDGYLSLTGRLKELINCGGEKISPLEIDEALMRHPAVQQAVAFGAPHEVRGEEVSAAVVLRKGAEATPELLRDFVSHDLAAFKVPRRIFIVDRIPTGPTGKLQRIGLAACLGLS